MSGTVTQALPRHEQWEVTGPDPVLLALFGSIMAFGLIMVFSATVSNDHALASSNFKHVILQLAYLVAGLCAAIAVSLLPLSFWNHYSKHLLFLGFALLLIVLIPGIGISVNGSQRWLPLGPIRMQPSELMKLFIVVYTAGFLVRQGERVKEFKIGILSMGLVIITTGVLLLLEPDFGSTVVIAATVIAMMFLGGVKVTHFLLCLGIGFGSFAVLAMTSPYRLQRVMSFMDPFSDPFNSGFQLVQALIAIGRGEWLGVGLGNSIQKLFYLPHAHNDFLLAVIGEELGFIGLLTLIVLFAMLISRILRLALLAERSGRMFEARVAQGIGLLLAIQAIINIGVNLGVLPTKGLTLPFMSYGGSSLVANCLLMGVLFAIDREVRQKPGGEQ